MQAIHYIPKKISDLKQTDRKVAIMGKIISAEENSFVVDDESGKVEIFSEEPVESNKLVRAFCTVIEGRLKADAVQDLNNFDLNLYRKIKELYRKIGV